MRHGGTKAKGTKGQTSAAAGVFFPPCLRAYVPSCLITMSWTSLCELSELEEAKGKYVEIGGFQLAVFLSGGQDYVMDNYCPHAGGNLAGGIVEEGCAVCP